MKLETVSYPEQYVCTLTMSANGEALEAAAQAAYEAKRAELKIKGFERGEATREDAEAVKGQDFFWFDAANNILDAESVGVYNAFVKENDLIVVSECEYDLKSINKDDGFVVDVTFCLQPKLTLGEWKGRTFTQRSAKVTEEEVSQYCNPKEDLSPEEVEELRAKVREKLVENKALSVVAEAQNNAIATLADLAVGENPTPLIEQAYEGMLNQLNEMLQKQGANMAQFLEKTGHTKEEFRETTRKGADRRVRATLALMQIGIDAGFIPTDEAVEAEVLVRAEQVKGKVKDFATKADRRRVKLSMIRKKATDLVLEHTTFIDPDKGANEE